MQISRTNLDSSKSKSLVQGCFHGSVTGIGTIHDGQSTQKVSTVISDSQWVPQVQGAGTQGAVRWDHKILHERGLLPALHLLSYVCIMQGWFALPPAQGVHTQC